MNALYQLQISLWEEDALYLDISALRIHLETRPAKLRSFIEGRSTVVLPEQSRNEALRAYYLDWSHYNDADEASVKQLLNSFWEHFLNPEQHKHALNTLQITESSPTSATIKQQFRQLAAKHHPDKGGNPERFIAIREAYEILSTR
jgi:hypothetical protein